MSFILVQETEFKVSDTNFVVEDINEVLNKSKAVKNILTDRIERYKNK